MFNNVLAFSDEQARIAVNLAQQYDAWVEAERRLFRLPYGMRWKTKDERDYLCAVIDRQGNLKSLGPRSDETERQYAAYRSQKEGSTIAQKQSRERLVETCALYRTLKMPMIPAEAAKILREADRRSLLGSKLLVVGTNAMAAYALEAGGFIVDAPSETQDFDMAWASMTEADDMPVWTMLKAVDPTYTVNTERPFQARNASAYEVELLVAPSRATTLQRRDCPKPVPLEEQEWLLLGTTIDHVVVARDGSPARIVAPDPRWFALQKLWMSAQEKRDPLKRPKDAKQGMALLSAVRDAMPQYSLGDVFETEIPDVLKPHFERWRQQAGEAPPSTW